MLVRKIIDLNTPLTLTPEQESELENLSKMSDDDIVFDDECPELTDEQLKQFRRVNPRPKKAVG